jgi:hypothetical protein
MKSKVLLAIFILAAFASCKKKDDDFRDKYVGAYECQITGKLWWLLSYSIVIDSSKITYVGYKEGYSADNPDSSLVSHNEEFITLTDTIYVKAEGASDIVIESAHNKFIGKEGDEFSGPHKVSISRPDYAISISEDGKFSGGKDSNGTQDNISGLLFDGYITMQYKHSSRGVVTVNDDNLYYFGRKIK